MANQVTPGIMTVSTSLMRVMDVKAIVTTFADYHQALYTNRKSELSMPLIIDVPVPTISTLEQGDLDRPIALEKLEEALSSMDPGKTH
ncbi:hypothetical protein NDU88_007056 [Pleurodeles waltl]|uniref:Uncharacterized protein n=1 Tax=Pleurodeles waltl TaxID=8319 RepID=A0AAV7TYX0_PLEWA|nr:hypothetical protein NDU88_007056 [Pleurodeles waltl]